MMAALVHDRACVHDIAYCRLFQMGFFMLVLDPWPAAEILGFYFIPQVPEPWAFHLWAHFFPHKNLSVQSRYHLLPTAILPPKTLPELSLLLGQYPL